MKKYIGIASGVLLIILIVSFIIYSKSHMSLWGYKITEKDCKKVIVYTTKDVLLITDSKAISEVTGKLDEMVKVADIKDDKDATNEMTTPEKYTKVKIQTSDNAIYGGKFWIDDGKLLMEEHECLWSVDKSLLDLLDKYLVGAKSMVE